MTVVTRHIVLYVNIKGISAGSNSDAADDLSAVFGNRDIGSFSGWGGIQNINVEVVANGNAGRVGYADFEAVDDIASGVIGGTARLGKLIADDAGRCIVTGNQQLPLRAVNGNRCIACPGNIETGDGNGSYTRYRLDINRTIYGGTTRLGNTRLARLQLTIKIVN